MRVAQPIVLKEEIRRKLEQQARRRSIGARAVMRIRANARGKLTCNEKPRLNDGVDTGR